MANISNEGDVMQFESTLERVIGFVIMVVAPVLLLIGIVQWMIEDEQRVRGAIAITVGYGILAYLYWIIKSKITKES